MCEDLSTPWRIVQDFESLNQPTKDTGRYLAAGAREVRWLIVNPDHVDAGVRSVLAGIEGGPIIVEGNSFLDHVSG
ncbi:MAG: hypothetical protein CMJ83_09985, partial [Planctomycetes bacterium]|nr:hypothetical protein [Planctomycetota bacterium]